MGVEGMDFEGLEGVSPSFVEALSPRYRRAPPDVDPSWGRYFDGIETAVSGPSWARANWPLYEPDALTDALDPTRMQLDPPPARTDARPVAAPPASRDEIVRAASDSIRAMMLIRTYRVRGHLAANLDPLGLAKHELPADLTPEYHGFFGSDLDRPIFLGGTLGVEYATVNEIVEILRANYCSHVGLEYMHIGDVEERRFLQERIEGRNNSIEFTVEGKRAILTKVVQAEQWEKFCGRKYVGTKRFGLDGGEAMIPALESVIKYSGQSGVTEIVIGMAHRGRLNVLANVMAKPYRAIFSEFAGGSSNPEDVGGSGDVKYHLGTSPDRDFDGNVVHLSLAPNPSHLEAADGVVLGKARAKQTKLDDLRRERVVPVLIHGDAALAGQGIVMECFGFSGLAGYNTGGCIHFVINNQVGFTTSPQFALSSPYPSDIA
jgi:2-oxoglutarate dehydrogenase E1 component